MYTSTDMSSDDISPTSSPQPWHQISFNDRPLADAAMPSNLDQSSPSLPQMPPQHHHQLPSQHHALPRQLLNPKMSKRTLRHIFSRSKLSRDKQTDLDSPPINSDIFSIQSASPTLHNSPYPSDSLDASWSSPSKPLRSRPLQLQSRSLSTPTLRRKSSLQEFTIPELPESLAAWEMPQLFKAFPQTIRQATLTAVTMPTELVLRLHEKQTSAAAAAAVSEVAADHLTESPEKPKKKHSKMPSLANLQWTTKIYILATSGYLLQYTGTGAYDRLPEKVLRLSPTSAAFVTDSIPGQHWVLQVSATTELDAALPTHENKSFLSKLSMLAGDRRDSANMLMVFDSASDMNSWMMTLRGEIEKLSGKRKMSAPSLSQKSSAVPPLNSMVAGESKRFQQQQQHHHHHHHHLSPSHVGRTQSIDSGNHYTPQTMLSQQHNRQKSLDDVSTTNSLLSQDGQQLDNLRHSNGNRLSFSSTDRHTAITSAASSPQCSPVMEVFSGSSIDKMDLLDEVRATEAQVAVDAAVMFNRRSVMQNAAIVLDTTTGTPNMHTEPSGLVAPNFSVPQSSSRRFSHARGISASSIASSSSSSSSSQPSNITLACRATKPKSPRVPPPWSRPLSMAVEQQSVRVEVAVRPPTADDAATHVLWPVEERHGSSPRIPAADNRWYVTSSAQSSVVGGGEGGGEGVVMMGGASSHGDSGRRGRRSLSGARVGRGSFSEMASTVGGRRGMMKINTKPEFLRMEEKRRPSFLPPIPPTPPPPPSGPLPELPDYAQGYDKDCRSMPRTVQRPAMPPLDELTRLSLAVRM